ncbi:MAG: tRNA (adenosine(37)-N6)-threonylcarbamoyltransferase complex ATPase subunit type 1 TsaE [Actinomycetota bacterium]
MPQPTIELLVHSLAGTRRVAASIAELSRPGDVIVLAGEMGAGKTAFAQGFGKALGVTEPITSPTFTLVHSYDVPEAAGFGRCQLHHADLYRLDRTAEVADLALVELAEDRGIVLVEWGDVVDTLLGDHLAVHLDADTSLLDASALDDERVSPATDGALDQFGLDAERAISLAPVGSAWAQRWDRLVAAVEEFRC